MVTVDGKLCERLRTVKEAVSEHLLQDPNVIGLGVGFAVRGGKLTLEPALRVYVRAKFPKELLPKEALFSRNRFDDLPVDVIEGSYRPASTMRYGGQQQSIPDPPESRTMWRPVLVGGISVGNSRLPCGGTLGAVFVAKTDDQPVVLTSWHVLLAGQGAPRDPVCQPAAVYHRSDNDTFIGFVDHGVIDERMDAAIARLEGTRRFTTGRVLSIGMLAGTAEPRLGMEVQKSGAGSGRTQGMIDDASFTYRVQYPGFQQLFKNQLHLISRTGRPMSCAGDSGSVLVEADTRRAVGLLYAEEAAMSSCDFAVASPIIPVLQELNIALPDRQA